MEPVDEVKQAEANLRKAEAELEKAQADEKAAINDVEKAVEELKEAEHRHHGEGLVRIYIDREVYESPSPTTGEALYELAHIAEHRELFCEVGGDHEDHEVPRDATVIHLKEDDHFYSQKAVTILVNGEPHEETETRISFEEVVKLAYPVPPSGSCIEFTVSYRNGPSTNPKGTLTIGHSVKIKNRMIFDVTPTDRS